MRNENISSLDIAAVAAAAIEEVDGSGCISASGNGGGGTLTAYGRISGSGAPQGRGTVGNSLAQSTESNAVYSGGGLVSPSGVGMPFSQHQAQRILTVPAMGGGRRASFLAATTSADVASTLQSEVLRSWDLLRETVRSSSSDPKMDNKTGTGRCDETM